MSLEGRLTRMTQITRFCGSNKGFGGSDRILTGQFYSNFLYLNLTLPDFYDIKQQESSKAATDRKQNEFKIKITKEKDLYQIIKSVLNFG